MMERDDLIQDCWLVFTRCKAKYGDKPKAEFDKILKQSLNNEVMSISMDHSNPRRSAPMVDLEDEIENLSYSQEPDLDFKDNLNKVYKLLDPVSRRVMEELLTPSPEVIRRAEIDRMRRRKVASQGFKVKNAEGLAILDRHIAEELGITKLKMTYHRDEIRIAAIRCGLNKQEVF